MIWLVIVSAVIGAALTAAFLQAPWRRGRGVPHEDHDVWEALHLEVERARRYDGSFALVRLSGRRIEVDGRWVRLGGDGPATRLRRTDSAWGGARRAYVLVPLGTRRELHGLLRRMANDLDERAELRAVCFPDDAVTEHALLEALDTDVALGHPAGPRRDADVESIWSIASAESREAS